MEELVGTIPGGKRIVAANGNGRRDALDAIHKPAGENQIRMANNLSILTIHVLSGYF